MANFGDDIFFSSIPELNAKLQARDFSARELARAFCGRIEELGPRYNALALSLRKSALNQAGDVDGDLKRNRFRGPLQGIPYGVKDSLSIAYLPTAWGARPYADQRFDHDAAVIAKLNSVGAIATSKLSMIELAGAGGYSFPSSSITGPGLNPWNTARWSGGSSSGPAGAVASGLVCFALASETCGSILLPSAFCGVTGLRPTYGYVSRYGAMAVAWSMDKIGPICRSAEDCGLVLHVISGGDARDISSSGKRYYYVPQFARKFSDITIGYAPSDFEDSAPGPSRPAFREAFGVIRSMGFKLKEVELPDLPYDSAASLIMAAESSAFFEPLISSGRVDELADQDQIAGLKAGLEITAKDYLRAARIRALVQNEFRSLFSDVDILLSPTAFMVAPSVSDRISAPVENNQAPGPRGLFHLIAAGNLAGLPALSLPCGFAEGLPLGISLVGRPFYENTLLAVGREFQNQTDWHRRRPNLSPAA